MKGRKGKATGGDASTGSKEWEQDSAKKNKRYTFESNVNDEAEERKAGGKAMKKHKGRKARKAGGRVGANNMPLSTAHAGTMAKGRKAVDID